MKLYAPITDDSPVLDVADVVALEQRIAAEGTPLSELMLRAGTALSQYAADQCEPDDNILILCGSGNNGGDGWVAARMLALRGYSVTLVTPKPARLLRTEPAHSAAMRTTSSQLSNLQVISGRVLLPDTFEEKAIIIDCILGTGFDAAEVKEPYAEWIRQANAAKGFKLACDVPSGLSAQTGKAADVAFAADATVTMLAAKTGLLASEAAPYVGEVFLAPLED